MKYSLGLDIGTTSIGWAVIDLDNQRVHDVGVRIFEKPEDSNTGKSLAEPRRTARSTRRRLKRRRQRLNALKQFFIANQLLDAATIEQLLAPETKLEPYSIREKAINEKVSNEELFVALYHIAKRRGYKSNRKSLEEKNTESSRVLSAISENASILAGLDTVSVAVALNRDDKFADHKRNKRDDYNNSFVRGNFEDEAKAIIAIQCRLGLVLNNEQITTLLYGNEKRSDYTGIFSQRPFMTSDLIQKMRGKCELEPHLPRAPRASYSYELFRLAQNLSHLRIVIDSKVRALTADEISAIVSQAKDRKPLTYSTIRRVLGYEKSDTFTFARGMIRGKVKADDKTGGEGNKFDELTFYHTVKSALKESPDDWSGVNNNTKLFDAIGEALTTNKDDVSLRSSLAGLQLSEISIVELLKLNFSGFGHLSLAALGKITPHLLAGMNYDEALREAGYPSAQALSGDKRKLPSLGLREAEQITNPVVKRAIGQTIKVVNAVIRKYGMPTRIGIEAAGDLAKNFRERNDIKKLQDENAEYNNNISSYLKGDRDGKLLKKLTVRDKDTQILQSDFRITTPTGLQITKFKLYQQQNGKCMYSGKSLEIERLFDDEHYGEIDHIIPFSRCGNDSLNNKVLVLSAENRNKGNWIPYEAWGGDDAKWAEFEARVKATFLPFAKKDRLLAKNPPPEEWNERALNDTRYISKFLRQYLRQLDFNNEKGAQRVITPTGPITSYLRRIWRVGSKVREESNLHHAADACIIASIDQGIIQKVSSLNQYYELFYGTDKNETTNKLTGEIVHRGDLEQHIADVQPWEEFGKEVRLRTAEYKTPNALRNELRGLPNYDEALRESIRPIFVSRMPKRSGKGATNQDTIRSPKIVEDYKNDKGEETIARKQRISLSELTLKNLYDSPIRKTDPKLYEVLNTRLEANSDDPKKAFAERVYKPTKTGGPGNIVRSIKVYDTLKSKTGFYINDSKAFVNNGSTIRLDVYQRKNFKGKYEYYFVPIYTHMLKTKKIDNRVVEVISKPEILPTPNGRSADEKTNFDAIRDADGKIYATVENEFEKEFSIYPNDYVRIYMSNKIKEGYYVKYNISNGDLQVISHTASDKDVKELIHISPRSAASIERFDISVLGDNYKWM